MLRKERVGDADLADLVAKMEELLREVYNLGLRNAVAEIMKAADGATFVIPERHATPPSRAPRGTSQALIKRALANGPLTAKQIANTAKTDDEKKLSFSAVYLELVRGKNEKRYRQIGSKWSLFQQRAE